jgi:hypothetical protein
VTITVHGPLTADSAPGGNLVGGVLVTGSWGAAPGNGSASCTTNTTGANIGRCTVTRTGLNRSAVASVTYSVSQLTSGPGGYQAADNHDPDAAPQNSNGTTITVPRP